MPVLVLNSGSSSLKFSLFDASAGFPVAQRCLIDAELSGIGESATYLEVSESDSTGLRARGWNPRGRDLPEAIHDVLELLEIPSMPPIRAVGYRIVHPGPHVEDHQRITPQLMRDLRAAVAFAPLHDPSALTVIRETVAHFPQIPHFACFDTVFHRTMPEAATTYALPAALRDKGVHRYGFHGLSCESIVQQLTADGAPIPHRMVIAHLGSGCSVTALLDGKSVDTSMGLTPTGGVIMGTRPGDLDPGLVLYLLRHQEGEKEAALAKIETMLNHDAGMVALSGLPNDVKAVREAAAQGDKNSLLALAVFTRSVTKAIGSFAWLLGGLDALVFTGGIGEHDAHTRAEVLTHLQALGVILDPAANQAAGTQKRSISASNSAIAVLVAPAQEDLMIATHVDRMLRSST